jgi:HEPN domain-containing protein
MKRASREWVRKAEADWKGAVRLAGGTEPLHDLVCFHCQQTAEKYLKALLEELGANIPKTHDLEELLKLLLMHHGGLASQRRGLRFLTDFAVSTRYPGDSATKREAASCVRWTGRVRETCRSLLGIRPPRRRK